MRRPRVEPATKCTSDSARMVKAILNWMSGDFAKPVPRNVSKRGICEMRREERQGGERRRVDRRGWLGEERRITLKKEGWGRGGIKGKEGGRSLYITLQGLHPPPPPHLTLHLLDRAGLALGKVYQSGLLFTPSFNPCIGVRWGSRTDKLGKTPLLLNLLLLYCRQGSATLV